jgi:hypothetical protein
MGKTNKNGTKHVYIQTFTQENSSENKVNILFFYKLLLLLLLL